MSPTELCPGTSNRKLAPMRLSIGDLTTGLDRFLTLAHSMRSRVYKTVRRPSVCTSVSLSHQSNAAATCGGFAAERRTLKRYRSTAPGARGRSTALSSKCWQCHVDSRSNEAEPRLGLLSILGLLKFYKCSLLVWNLCPDGNMPYDARNYISTHWADWTWMDRRAKISRISSWKIWQPYVYRDF